VVRPRLCSLSWFKNISFNDAKQAAKSLAENRYLACPDVLHHRIALFVCFSPGVIATFYIDEVKWDAATPGTIGTPLRMGTPPFCQEFDELAEIEARFIAPLIARKNEVVTHAKYHKMTASEVEFVLRSQAMSINTSQWALIPHEDKPGVFKFVWYTQQVRQLRHQSFICLNNGYFFDNKHHPKLSALIRYIQALVSKPATR